MDRGICSPRIAVVDGGKASNEDSCIPGQEAWLDQQLHQDESDAVEEEEARHWAPRMEEEEPDVKS